MEQPKWYEYMSDALAVLSDGSTKSKREMVEAVSKHHGLTKELLEERLSSGELRYSNRIGWAMTYLKQAGLIETLRKGFYSITESGKALYAKKPIGITEDDLKNYAGYSDFKTRSRSGEEKSAEAKPVKEESLTPEEMLEKAEAVIKQSVCSELLEKARSISPDEFERLVIDLIKKMGYGDDSDALSGIHTGKSGDGGIDGIIKQDKLGLDTIYIQAKRYKEGNNVTPHDIRDFIGSVSLSKGSKKGIFITTSSFTDEGRKHAEDSRDPRIILIDGARLSELMYEYGIGVTDKKIITIRKIDSDYFEL